MNTAELHKFLAQWKGLRAYPSASGWPQGLSLPSDVWKKLSDIQRYTSKDGHEYAVNLFYVDGEIIVTPYTRGTEENVKTRDQVQVKLESKDGVNYTKKILVNSNTLKTLNLKKEKISEKIEINHLFNIHTHPTQFEIYSFFSPVDIRSFLGSSMMVMGLITDRLWLICKTKNSLSMLGENGETQISYISHQIFSGRSDIDTLIKENLSSWNVVFYEGGFNKQLKKIN